MKRVYYFSVIGLLIVFFSSASSWATTTGAVEGVVRDAKTGEAIFKAKITLVSEKFESIRKEVYSDKKGHFYQGGLVPGRYKIAIEKEGYLPVLDSVRVRLDETSKVEINLEIFSSRPTPSSKLSSEGSGLLNEGKYEEAIAKFTEAIAKDQANPILYYYRAAAFEKNGNLEKAIEDYQKSIEMKPDFILPFSRLGIVYAKQGNFEKAIENYRKATELGAKDATIFYNYGVCLMNLGHKEEAKVVLEKLISLDANYSDAYYQLGTIYLGLGETARAKEFLQKFIEMDPENKNVLIAKEILKSLS